MSEPMLSCQKAVELMWAYIDGELPALEGAAVKTHLAACNRCYPHYDFQKAFCEFLRGHRGAGAPSELRRRLFLRLLAEERTES